MTNTFWLDPVHKTIFARLSTLVTDTDLQQMQRHIQATPGFESSWNLLIDCSLTTELRASGTGIRDLGQSTIFGVGSRLAIVAPQDEVFGVARMFELQYPGPATVMVFRDLPEARSWLGLDADARGA